MPEARSGSTVVKSSGGWKAHSPKTRRKNFDHARCILQYIHSQHPPDKEYRDDGPDNMNYPVANCFRFSKTEHSAMVAGTVRVN